MRRMALGSIVLVPLVAACAPLPVEVETDPPGDSLPAVIHPLVVSVLDVGQGDAVWIENGTSRVLVDGGQSTSRMDDLIREKALTGDTIDFMILSHAHADHHAGLRAFFESAQGVTVRRFYENQDVASGAQLSELRDSVAARASRSELALFDTDDPCADGSSVCTHVLDGGARLHILRPPPAGGTNDRSVALKLVGPDSASFTMWLSGDAEHDAIDHFAASYAALPGLDVDVLKGNHHGSCNGVTAAWLALTTPLWTTFGVSGTNSFGHVHEQAKALHLAAGAPWLRTDENGRITFTAPGTPGSGFTVATERAGIGLGGDADREASAGTCG